MPGVKPLPAELAVPPPAMKPEPPETKLEKTLKQRRLERLQKEDKGLRRRYEEAQVEHKQAQIALTASMTKLAKVKRSIAEADSAMSAARKESSDLEKKL